MTPIGLDFRKASRQQAKACILIEGLPGGGKSGTALLIAHALAGNDWNKVYCTDTENKSLDLFDGITMSNSNKCAGFNKVDLLPIHGYRPSVYNAIKDSAIKAGGLVMINDSLTHMWQQKGGVLDLVSEAQKKNSKLNQWTAWGSPEVLSEKQAIYDVVRDSRIHVISTVRVKEKFEMGTGANGKSELQSLGEQQLMMPDLKYEPDLVLAMVKPGDTLLNPPEVKVTKSRYAIFTLGNIYRVDDVFLSQLVAYLNEGADPEVLKEQQRIELVASVKELLDTDASKATMFPILKEQQGVKDIPLAELSLQKLQTLLGILLA